MSEDGDRPYWRGLLADEWSEAGFPEDDSFLAEFSAFLDGASRLPPGRLKALIEAVRQALADQLDDDAS
ncbi:MAG: hypothetical protein Q8M88_14995 [Phenylobacterium sp.]|uniref:hypothetical protein n=1 Tax=Phenylobacterium sp. TaxID=1871053 RepID=UPI002735FCEB|nr:hypothetical protein [Phenylobacterium sp.]MDP3175736.1 hypothetical protein [Phenylobacterium sp.]